MVKINKILLCGAKQVGKSAILEQLIYGHVNKESVRLEFCSLLMKAIM
jgi:GTPase SAR1 family protein